MRKVKEKNKIDRFLFKKVIFKNDFKNVISCINPLEITTNLME